MAASLPLHDLRSFLSDDCFLDLLHKNHLGRRLMTAKLADIYRFNTSDQ